MNVLFIASIAVVTADPPQGRELFIDALGLPLEANATATTPAPASPAATTSVFGPSRRRLRHASVRPSGPPTGLSSGSIEFEVEDVGAVAAAGDELQQAGFELMHPARTEPWGQTVARLLTQDGPIVSISYAPAFHGEEPA